MRISNGIAMAMALTLLAPAAAMAGPNEEALPNFVKMEAGRPHAAELDSAVALLQSGKPDKAEAIFSVIIADMEKTHGPAVPFRCVFAESVQQTIAYTTKKLGQRPFILGSDVWCTALWGKGFALIDLRRSEEAGPFLARAVEMMPVNAHFINEYAEWYKSKRDAKTSFDLFMRAWHTVGHDLNGSDRKIAARSLRGMAYNLIEQGDLDGAERLYRQSLDYELEAAGKVQQELDYIKEQKAKAGKLS